MMVLFDTDILLQREDNQILSDELSNLIKMIEELKYTIYVHELSLGEIQRDVNSEKAKVSYSKIKSYPTIKNHIDYKEDKEFISIIANSFESKENNNNQLIYTIYKNIADYLITEDKDILNKAEKLNLDKKILNINEAITLFKGFLPDYKINILPFFKVEKGFNLNIDDSIFDTLKEEYAEFNSWWKNSASKRPVYVYLDEKNKKDKIKALLVPKIEDNEAIDCAPELILGKRVKICLFKVAEHGQGLKLGERLLSMAFDFAVKNNIDTLYLTHFTIANDYLVKLIEEYGFYKHGKNERGEEIFVKHITQNRLVNTDKDELIQANQEFFPSFYDGKSVNKHIVPIYPKYHKMLFPDCKNYKNQFQLKLNLFIDKRQSSEGNCIKKAYVCNAPTKKVKKGDILLFYRSEDKRCITSLGVVDEVYTGITDAKIASNLIFKRTVYKFEELEEKTQNKNPLLIILFKHHFHLSEVFYYKDLLNNDVVSGPIQTITEISDDNYNKIIAGRLNERFIINKT